MVRVLLPRNIIHLYYTIDLKFFQVLKIKKDEREHFLTKHSLSLANNTASINIIITEYYNIVNLNSIEYLILFLVPLVILEKN